MFKVIRLYILFISVLIILFILKFNRCMEEYCKLCPLESYNVCNKGEPKISVDVTFV